MREIEAQAGLRPGEGAHGRFSENVRVVLCGAEEAGNVGSACRAMKTMGFGRLALVGCPEYDAERVRIMAVHAFDVYQAAERFPDLAAALSGANLSAGFTRRRGVRRKSFSLSAADFAEEALRRPSSEIAMVFGNERAGLSREELDLCTLAVHIPTAKAQPSLNLAMAVQLACYEIRRAALGDRDGSAWSGSSSGLLRRAEIEESVARMAGYLRAIGFFKITRDRDLCAFLRDTAERAAYCPSELRYLESVFRKAAGMIRGAGDQKTM
ncbi:MAG: RNA methyltransferase [Spirochaetaceae bacterium]|nr:RNA methyltransferase [Spirochaetaceae bacterium]